MKYSLEVVQFMLMVRRCGAIIFWFLSADLPLYQLYYVDLAGRLVLKKKLYFCVGEYAENGFDQQRLIWYICRLWPGIWCLAGVSSVSPSSVTEGLWGKSVFK